MKSQEGKICGWQLRCQNYGEKCHECRGEKFLSDRLADPGGGQKEGQNKNDDVVK